MSPPNDISDDRKQATDHGISRREAIKRGVGTLVATTLLSSSAFAQSSGNGKTVSPGQAKKAAKGKLKTISKSCPGYKNWSNAKVKKPVPYFALTESKSKGRYQRAVYVFTVDSGGEELGYITIGARTGVPTLLEFSKAEPPHENIPEITEAAEQKGYSPKERLVFTRGCNYGIQIGDGMEINLKSGRVGNQPKKTLKTLMSNNGSVTGSGQPSSTTSSSTISTTSTDESYQINGVPCWDANEDNFTDNGYTSGSDPGNGSEHWSDSIGSARDPWGQWDGCGPVSAAMIIMYHEDINKSDIDEREGYVDWLHRHMRTNQDGYSYFADYDDGINRFDEGGIDYQGKNHDWLSKSLAKGEINNDRPFMLSLTNHWYNSDDATQDAPSSYNQHTIACVGYFEEDGKLFLTVHDGWADVSRTVSWDNWESANDLITTIKP